MKIPKEIINFSKTVWWFIVAVSIIIGIVVGIRELLKKPSIFSQIINEINVLDIHQPLKDLQILFQGDNIQEKNLNLRIYKVKIENNGGTNITQNDFDQVDNWGIKVNQGKIIETRLVDSNSQYINTNLSPQIQNSDIVKFNKIIFDKGNFFTIELLVLHDKKIPPILYRIGKIAGIQENESKILTIERSEPFWKTFFYGNWIVNAVRFIIYGLIAFAIVFAIIFLIVKLQEKRKRKAQSPQPPQKPS